ncbi:Phosphate transport system permease protein PstA (TC 3.A.1.7.1) [hydrothermal vent metagenome]|uniref:Phosphate transport system permease protein PstA (TC 3.A.1.7.1) n=1 Tax=hydrothermal vent metagenome TaxID=652676 RepID=A0A3B0ZM56_9ZZZZ
MHKTFSSWWKTGAPWIWLNAAAVAASLSMVVGLLLLIAINGLGHFWPKAVWEIEYREPDGQTQRLIGEIVDTEKISHERMQAAGKNLAGTDKEFIERYLLKTGNRDVSGLDFRWISQPSIIERSKPERLVVFERVEWGNFYGFLDSVSENGEQVAKGGTAWEVLQTRLDRVDAIRSQIRHLEKSDIGTINYNIEQLRLEQRKLELEGRDTPAALAEIEQQRSTLQAKFVDLRKALDAKYAEISRDSVAMTVMDGRSITVPLDNIVRAYQPNGMSLPGKIAFYIAKLWEFVSADPREANTEGGIFPAIFGTVMMVLLMSVIVTPFGVVAAVYLREYAKQGPVTRLIRIAVNNLAGVPSIVYGVFGLGFFVYFLGGNIDQLFFPEALPAPTFGTPGLMWASLTLALLTLPVVIVATEEGLARIPSSIREGSLALGATKAETLWRTVLPMSTPAMMTGLILAVARAAGEVAPLMLVGVVKLAPALPLDTNSPFLHLDRKFMHLGFHIYDVGFQSPNVEAARPLVYATALLLVAIIIILNLAAIAIRNRLRERYRELEQ